jgi:drug/metabolite transporter (DMT)-like permease
MTSPLDTATPGPRVTGSVPVTDAPPPRRSNAGFTGTDVMLLAMSAIWGINFAVMKYGLDAFTPLAFNALRVTLACTALAAVAFAPGARRPSSGDARKLMALGLIGHSVYQFLFANGLNWTRAGTAALVISGTPAVVAIFARIVGYERISRHAALGIVLSIVGIACVVFGAASASHGEDSLLGIALILTSSVCWAVYTMGLRPLSDRIDGVQIAAWTLFGGALPMILAGVPSLLSMDFATVPPAAWGAIAYSGLGAYVLAYVFWYRGVQRLGPTRTSMYANLQPIIALGAAWATLGERPTPWQFTGGACVITGLYLSRR